jgi:hypothetical protein
MKGVTDTGNCRTFPQHQSWTLDYKQVLMCTWQIVLSGDHQPLESRQRFPRSKGVGTYGTEVVGAFLNIAGYSSTSSLSVTVFTVSIFSNLSLAYSP